MNGTEELVIHLAHKFIAVYATGFVGFSVPKPNSMYSNEKQEAIPCNGKCLGIKRFVFENYV
jgi:hypothetical protein